MLPAGQCHSTQRSPEMGTWMTFLHQDTLQRARPAQWKPGEV